MNVGIAGPGVGIGVTGAGVGVNMGMPGMSVSTNVPGAQFNMVAPVGMSVHANGGQANAGFAGGMQMQGTVTSKTTVNGVVVESSSS